MMARYWTWLLPLLAVVLYAPYAASFDFAASDNFFHNGSFTPTAFDQLLYKLGELPGLAVGSFAILAWIGSYVSARFRQWRQPAGAIALAFIIGPGILVNVVLKDHWGRPRPRQIEQFGGTATYQPFYKPNFKNHGDDYKSFPSGHVSMGFFFLVVALVARKENYPKIFWGSLILAFVLGSLLAMTRIAQGGHFLSDTILAAFIMWWVSLACVRIAYGPDESNVYAT